MSTPILTFFNQKGGVGKTTCSVSVAGALAKDGARVLFVDMDAQRSGTLMLGAKRPEVTLFMALVTPQMAPFSGVLCETGNPRILCAPASRYSDEGDLREFCLRNPHALKNALEGVANEFDFIVIDSPNHRSPAVAMSLLAATCAVLVVKCEPLTMPAIEDAAATIEQARAAGNNRLQVRALINEYGKDALSDEVSQTVSDAFPQTMLQTKVPTSKFLKKCLLYADSCGGSVVDFAPKSNPAARAFCALAGEFQIQFGGTK